MARPVRTRTPEPYTMEYVKHLQGLSPTTDKWLGGKEFAQRAAKSQEELDALKEYYELYAKKQAAWGPGVFSEEEKRRLAELKPQVAHLIGYATEQAQAATKYWGDEEETIPQTTQTFGGQEYLWTGGGYMPAPMESTADYDRYISTLQAQGIPPSSWVAKSPGASPEAQSYIAQQAAELATPLPTTRPPTAAGGVTPTVPTTTPTGAEMETPSWWTGAPEEYQRWYQEYYAPTATEAGLPEGYMPTGMGAGMPIVEGEAPAGRILVTEGPGWRLYESSGVHLPGSTPEGVGFIASGTDQAEIFVQDMLTGEWVSSGKFIQLSGSPEQVQAGYTYLQTLGAGALPEGYWESPFDIPPEVSQNYPIVYDPNTMTWRVGGFEGAAAGMSEFEQQYMESQLELDRQAQALREQEFQWKQEQAGQLTAWQEEQIALEERRLAESREMTEYQAEQLRLQEQQQTWQQAEAKRQYESQLAARGGGAWMESAAYTGRPPVVQHWQVPLMPEQYGLQAGQPIPGWTAETAQGMPQMTRPSRQYQARMGPTAMAQLGSYRQARTGATPEETQWRQWSVAPPGGQASRLSWTR